METLFNESALELPLGVDDLDSQVILDVSTERRVRCYVRGCSEFLRPPSREYKGDVCPKHQIRCHVSGKTGTYSYPDPRRNVIVAPRLFSQYVVRSPFKFESHRLGAERSEDTLTWNVFRSLFEHQTLAAIANLMVGESHPHEPHLYLWGIDVEDFRPWPLLTAAREKFEAELPVDRPLTEPDIALHLPGRYLILIEAKFTSANTFYEQGPRKDSRSLSKDELVSIYQFVGAQITNPIAAERAPRVPHQLWRNTVFSEWMAREDHPRTKAFHVNLVRSCAEQHVPAEFRSLLVPGLSDRFQRATWEQIHEHATRVAKLTRLREYMARKTAGLRKAFELS